MALSVALYTAVEAGHLRWGAAIAVFFFSAGLFVVVVRKHEPGLFEVAQMAQQAALFAVVILLGEVVRNRRRYQDEVRGIERRSRTIITPTARLALLTPDFFQRFVERMARRRHWAAAIQNLEQASQGQAADSHQAANIQPSEIV